MMRKQRLLLAMALAAVVSSPGLAATQGTPGPTSTGTVTINASITPEVNITSLDDITFSATLMRGALATGADVTGGDQFCIWSNNPDGSYFITATGNGAGNAFSLTDGTRTLPYSVAVTTAAQPAGANLTTGVKSGRLTSPATVPDCAGATTANLLIRITNANIATMEATTTYTGVLTLLVSPT